MVRRLRCANVAVDPVCGELLIFDTNQQFATHGLGRRPKPNRASTGGDLTLNRTIYCAWLKGETGRRIANVLIVGATRERALTGGTVIQLTHLAHFLKFTWGT
jgi:hypothetical protein